MSSNPETFDDSLPSPTHSGPETFDNSLPSPAGLSTISEVTYVSWYASIDAVIAQVKRLNHDVEVFEFEWERFTSESGIKPNRVYRKISPVWWDRYSNALNVNRCHFRMLEEKLSDASEKTKEFEAKIDELGLDLKEQLAHCDKVVRTLEKQYEILKRSLTEFEPEENRRGSRR